jgi:hypothetical protein
MTISEIKRWAKGLGYHAAKNNEDNKYYWKQYSSDDADNCGIATSVSKLAKAIYNHYTKYKWVEHQENFINQKIEEEKIVSPTEHGT